MAFPQTLNPSAPSGSDSPRLGDDQIRDLKQFLADLFGLPTSPTQISATIGSVSAGGKLTLTNALWNADTLTVAYGGLGITSGTSGGIVGFTGATTIASSGLLAANALLLGGGAGATPSALGSLGTTTTVLHGNAAGAPTFGAVSLTADVSGILPSANGGSGIAYFTAAGPTMARVYTFPDAAATVLTTNAAVTVAQGGTNATTAQDAINTLTTVAAATNEHVLTKDTATGNAIFKAVAGGGGGTVTHTSGALTINRLVIGNNTDDINILGSLGTTTTVLHGNAAGAPTFGAVSLTADVSGDLPYANFVQATAASKMVGRGSASGAGDFEEITLGSGLTMTGTTLSASGGSSITAATATVDSTESTSSTSYTDLTTSGPAVTLTVGSSGILLIFIQSYLSNDTAGAWSYVDFALSGGNTRSASDNTSLAVSKATNVVMRVGVATMLTGLTSGSTTVTTKYRVDSGTGTYKWRNLAVATW